MLSKIKLARARDTRLINHHQYLPRPAPILEATIGKLIQSLQAKSSHRCFFHSNQALHSHPTSQITSTYAWAGAHHPLHGTPQGLAAGHSCRTSLGDHPRGPPRDRTSRPPRPVRDAIRGLLYHRSTYHRSRPEALAG